MPYDPAGTGARPDDLLVRRGVSWESAARLERQALKAEQAGLAENGLPFGYGVSVTSPEANQRLARDPKDAVTATRRAFEEAGLEVRYTPTKPDMDHHTVVLAKPVTPAAAILFNITLGRTRKRP